MMSAIKNLRIGAIVVPFHNPNSSYRVIELLPESEQFRAWHNVRGKRYEHTFRNDDELFKVVSK